MARPLVEHFADLKDPRVNRTKKHRLDDILVIALSALLCGATTFEDIEEFAESREEWFRTFLPLPHGIPSHDTIYGVFCALDAKVFARCFAGWMAGGGVKGGRTIGTTDELGLRAVENKLHVHDLHATVLHLMGLDHMGLVYKYKGRPERPTLNEGEPYKKIAETA